MFPSIAELQAGRETKQASIAELLRNAKEQARTLTAEEAATFDRLSGEIEAADARIADVQATLDREEKAKALADKYNSGPGRKSAPDRLSVPASYKRHGSLKAFKGPNADERAYRSGMWLRATLLECPRAMSYCQNHGIISDVRNALGTNSNTSGGFLVPDEFSQTVIDLREQYGVFRREAHIEPMSRDTKTVPRRLGGVTVGAIGENPSSAISESNPTWNSVQLVAKKCGGLSKMSTEIDEDAVISMADAVAGEWAYAFALFEDQCGFIGDGSQTYLGIRGLGSLLTEAGGLAGAVLVTTATHNLFSEIDNTDLTAVMGKLPVYARMNAKWYCSSVAADMVFSRLQATAGGNTVQTLQGQTGMSYLGYPIVISQVLPAGPTTDYNGLPMLYFGDLRKSSTLGDRRDVRVFLSEHRYMDTDQIGVRATERFDIVNHDVGDTTNAGPIVALVGSSS
jgi:HK97 family phage major capsid protein